MLDPSISSIIAAVIALLGAVYAARSAYKSGKNKTEVDRTAMAWKMHDDTLNRIKLDNEELKGYCESLERKIETYEKSIREYEMEILSLRIKMEDYRISIDQYKREKEVAESKVDELRARVEQLESEILEYRKAG